MQTCHVIRRAPALVLAFTVSIFGLPGTASAGGEGDPSARCLMIQGRPLGQVVGGTSWTSDRSSPGLLVPGGLESSAPQVRSGRSSQLRLPQSGSNRFWLALAVGTGAGLLTGWAIGASYCENEGGGADCTAKFVGGLGAVGAGIGLAFGSAL